MHARRLPFVLFAGIVALGLWSTAAPGLVRAAEPAAAEHAADDPTKVEFFEKLYKTEITGVKPLEDYDDPDSFYSAIAQQVGIPELAFEAAAKRFGWKKDDGFAYSAVVKGGWDAPNWGVMISRIPEPKQKPKTPEEMRALMKQMQLKFVVIGYDGTITFPKEDADSATGNASAPSKPKRSR
jgi:hypothetical protein